MEGVLDVSNTAALTDTIVKALLEEPSAVIVDISSLQVHAEAGWSAIVRFPATRSDEDLALTLLHDHDTLVHPGYFFDLTGGTFLVVSLLPPPEVFDAGTAAMIDP